MRFKLLVPYHANFRTFAATLRRSLPLAAVALALIALSALVACGGGSDDNGDAAQPPPATQPPAATGAGNGASTPTQPPADSGPAPTTGSNAVELFILALRFDSIELNLTAGDTVSVAYSAIGASTGGITQGGGQGGAREKQGPGTATGEVSLTVLNPVEEQILNVEQMSSNTAEFQADLTGMYQMVFSNPFRLQGLIVPVEYTINP